MVRRNGGSDSGVKFARDPRIFENDQFSEEILCHQKRWFERFESDAGKYRKNDTPYNFALHARLACSVNLLKQNWNPEKGRTSVNVAVTSLHAHSNKFNPARHSRACSNVVCFPLVVSLMWACPYTPHFHCVIYDPTSYLAIRNTALNSVATVTHFLYCFCDCWTKSDIPLVFCQKATYAAGYRTSRTVILRRFCFLEIR